MKRALALLIYKGTSLRELHDFLLRCEVYFVLGAQGSKQRDNLAYK
jgi:hypothetical protein